MLTISVSDVPNWLKSSELYTTPFQINDEPNGSREPKGSFGNSFLLHSIIHIKLGRLLLIH
uniref:Uncharacterized protein n=1 Tax=viral metagenome TaxID=1070528 RepID=A0A6C0AFQ4_9ZZZZ